MSTESDRGRGAAMSRETRRATRFGQMFHLWRTVNHLTLRDVAKETGISHASLMRIEHGYAMDQSTWMMLQVWLLKCEGERPVYRRHQVRPA